MQTFLTSTNFKIAASQLDTRRLGKQRVEVLQILNALVNPDYGWQNHPAVQMWRGYEAALARYGLEICEEWVKRGYKDTCFNKIVDLFDGIVPFQENPPWLTDQFCSVHRVVLLGKALEAIKLIENDYYAAIEIDPSEATARNYRNLRGRAEEIWDWYKQFNWSEQPVQRNEQERWPYIWPSEVEAAIKKAEADNV